MTHAGGDIITGEKLSTGVNIFATNGGSDSIIGTQGNDFVQYFGSYNLNLARVGRFYCVGNDGNDTIGYNPHHPAGTALSCVSVIDNQSGATIYGGLGDDEISGTTRVGAYEGIGRNPPSIEADFLDGGDGNDTVSGGDGYDTLIGGRGGDIFVISRSPEFPTIRDFNASEGDKLRAYSGLPTPEQVGFGISDNFTNDVAHYHLNTTSGALWFDPDGRAGAQTASQIAVLLGVSSLSSSSFI